MQSLLNHCPLLMGNNWEGGTSWALPMVWVATSLFGMAGPSLGWWQVSGSKLLLLPAWPHQIAVVFGDSCYSHPVAAVEKGNIWHWCDPSSSHANIPFCLVRVGVSTDKESGSPFFSEKDLFPFHLFYLTTPFPSGGNGIQKIWADLTNGLTLAQPSRLTHQEQTLTMPLRCSIEKASSITRLHS